MTQQLIGGYDKGKDADFRRDLAIGHQAELFVGDVAEYLVRHSREVKRDAKFQTTGNLFIEYESWSLRMDRMVPSGIATTDAWVWVEVLPIGLHQVLLAVPTEMMKAVARQCLRERGAVPQPNGQCPTNGVLVPVKRLLGMT